MESDSFINEVWAHLGNTYHYLTNYEKALGTWTVGAYIASFFTLLIFLSRVINLRLTGSKWDYSIAQGLIAASWIFPMLYLPYQGTPYWLTLLFGVTMWLGSWILLRNIGRSRGPYAKHTRPKKNSR